MSNQEKVKLLRCPYHAPALRVGDRATCLYRDCDVVIEVKDLALFVNKALGFLRVLAGEGEDALPRPLRPGDENRSGFTDEVD